MVRRTDVRRDTHPHGPALFADAAEKARLEARNGLRQFDEVKRLVEEAIASKSFKLRPSTLQSLQRFAIQVIYTCAGNFRTGHVIISGTTHVPPPPEKVPELVEDLCDYVNSNLSRSAVHLSSYVMWRLNWIHPFAGGNGRTSRALSYFVLCARAEQWFPGTNSIPEQITQNREPYYKALDAADLAFTKNIIDVGAMEILLREMLATQLVSAHDAATSER
jgi:Fic family protein